MDKILRNKKAIFIFIAPALIMFVLVLVIPMVQMVIILYAIMRH